MSELSYFDTLLNSDARAFERFSSGAAVLINQLAADGVIVTVAELRSAAENLPSLKLAVLTDDGLNVETAVAEVRKLPGVVAVASRAALQAGLERHEKAAQDRLASMTIAQRMDAGRALLQAQNKPKQKLAPDQEAAALHMLSHITNPAARISAARRLGLC